MKYDPLCLRLSFEKSMYALNSGCAASVFIWQREGGGVKSEGMASKPITVDLQSIEL